MPHKILGTKHMIRAKGLPPMPSPISMNGEKQKAVIPGWVVLFIRLVRPKSPPRNAPFFGPRTTDRKFYISDIRHESQQHDKRRKQRCLCQFKCLCLFHEQIPPYVIIPLSRVQYIGRMEMPASDRQVSGICRIPAISS